VILWLILGLPLLAALAAWFLPRIDRVAPTCLLAAVLMAGLSLYAVHDVAAGQPVVALSGWLALDGLGALIVLPVAWIGLLATLYSWGYLQTHSSTARQQRLYYVNLNLFIFALLAAPSLTEPNLVWMAIELTALFSVLLVAYEGSHEALEAAWKYIALMFMGAAIALLGFMLLYWAFRSAGGAGEYSWRSLQMLAPQLSPILVKTAFVLILVGFGAKVGLVPLHTWLPDAHSQAPAPACALLSGVKTTVALYVIMRLIPLLPAASIELWLKGFGVLSLVVAALLMLRVQDYKRLFAFSTVEHMGIVLIALGMGSVAADYAAMTQLISHSVTKSFCFFVAGTIAMLTGSHKITSVHGLIHSRPSIAVALLIAALAIAGAPPLAVFLSEFRIIKAGLGHADYVLVALLVVFIVVAFFALMWHVNRMTFGPPTASEAAIRLPWSCRLTLVIAAVPVLVLGLYQPEFLYHLEQLAAAGLRLP